MSDVKPMWLVPKQFVSVTNKGGTVYGKVTIIRGKS